jgi:TPP-dependent pyruvate/acetoin dehydrogenase alpha subunit
MGKIRIIEGTKEDLLAREPVPGRMHLSVGHEALAVGNICALGDEG